MNPINPYLERWITAVARDEQLTPSAVDVASVLADKVTGISRQSFTDWRRIWQQLAYLTRVQVLEALAELKRAGYLTAGRGLSIVVPRSAASAL